MSSSIVQPYPTNLLWGKKKGFLFFIFFKLSYQVFIVWNLFLAFLGPSRIKVLSSTLHQLTLLPMYLMFKRPTKKAGKRESFINAITHLQTKQYHACMPHAPRGWEAAGQAPTGSSSAVSGGSVAAASREQPPGAAALSAGGGGVRQPTVGNYPQMPPAAAHISLLMEKPPQIP